MSVDLLILQQGTTATIERPTVSLDASRYPRPSFASHLTSVPVFVQDDTGNEVPRYDAESNRKSVVVYILPGYDILAKDRIIVNSRTLDIQTVHTRALRGSNVYMKAECEETISTP